MAFAFVRGKRFRRREAIGGHSLEMKSSLKSSNDSLDGDACGYPLEVDCSSLNSLGLRIRCDLESQNKKEKRENPGSEAWRWFQTVNSCHSRCRYSKPGFLDEYEATLGTGGCLDPSENIQRNKGRIWKGRKVRAEDGCLALASQHSYCRSEGRLSRGYR